MPRSPTGGRPKAMVFLGASIIAAGLTAYLVIQVISKSREQLEEARKPPATVPVVVALRDLPMGVPLEEGDIVLRRLLPEMVPGNLAFRAIEGVVGHTPRERILSNEIIRKERLASRDAGIGLNALIPPGHRAMSVETDTESGVAGFVQPGNIVDVLVTIRPDDRSYGAKWVTETILQDVKVLAVGGTMGDQKKEAKDEKGQRSRRRSRPSVTLELTPEEAEKLALASSKGDIHLVLRSDLDRVQEESRGPLSTDKLIGFADAVEQRQPARGRRGPTVASTAEVIQGSKTTTARFDARGNKIED